jgi:lariat debranching enzyme
LTKIYDELLAWESVNNQKVDLLICCGDFQCLRNEADLKALECPAKFKKLGCFADYYRKKKTAPILTVFIGGNHEASNYLRELYYGGFAAENIYFMGASGVINIVKGDETLRIGAISGIEKQYDLNLGYYESYPYVHEYNNLKSMYHFREFEIAKLMQLKKPVDIFVSHEWPTVATSRLPKHDKGLSTLLKIKPYFKKEVAESDLGSRNLSDIVDALEPRFWFSAHLHCHFNSLIPTKSGIVEF